MMINEERFFANVLPQIGEKERAPEEIVENSRRAGATEVEFKIDTAEKTVKVTDNGKGVENFSELFVVAESNYNKEVMRTENPAGMGIYIILSTAKKAVFESGDKRLSVDVEKLFKDKEYRETFLEKIETTENEINGLSITLDVGDDISVYEGMMKATLNTYFDIDIIVNDRKIRKRNKNFSIRKDGVGELEGLEIGISSSYVLRSVTDKNNIMPGYVYWHGKEIAVKEIYPFTVIVKDNHIFKPVLPDRISMSNSTEELENIKKEIEKQLHEEIQRFFDEYKEDYIPIKEDILLDGKLSMEYNTDNFKFWRGISKDTVSKIGNPILLPKEKWGNNYIPCTVIEEVDIGEGKVSSSSYDTELVGMEEVLQTAGILFYENKMENKSMPPKWWEDVYSVEIENEETIYITNYTTENYRYAGKDNYNLQISEKIVFSIGHSEKREISSFFTFDDEPVLTTSKFKNKDGYFYIQDQELFCNMVISSSEYYYGEISNLLEEQLSTLSKKLSQAVYGGEFIENIIDILALSGKEKNAKIVEFSCKVGEDDKAEITVKTTKGEHKIDCRM